MRTCNEVCRLISEGLDRDLSTFQRLHLRVHLVLCVWCRRISRQFHFLHKMARRLGDSDFETAQADAALGDKCLTPDAKSRIKARLEGR